MDVIAVSSVDSLMEQLKINETYIKYLKSIWRSGYMWWGDENIIKPRRGVREPAPEVIR